MPLQGAFIEPTILLNVPTTSQAYQEEIFGPVVIVNSFETEDEVLSEANCTEFGLFCTSLTSNDFKLANLSSSFRVHSRLRKGNQSL